MNTLNDFELKQRKYMPVFPKASGKPTIYIEGYPYADDEPMPATEFHGEQRIVFYEQLSRYFQINAHIHVGIDSFIYYREGDITQCLAPDVYVALGADKHPLRRSFYTWAEGAIPTTIFEFLSDATANEDRHEKVRRYLIDMGAQEYFIHQPEMKKPVEFRGWRRNPSGGVVELTPDAQGGLFSEALNLCFRWEDQLDTHVRLLRSYLPDGTPITTFMEEHHLRVAAEERAVGESERRVAAEERAVGESERRVAAERLAREESERRQAVEVELERLQAQLANRQNENE